MDGGAQGRGGDGEVDTAGSDPLFGDDPRSVVGPHQPVPGVTRIRAEDTGQQGAQDRDEDCADRCATHPDPFV
ncbi:hypothetical protein GCM10022284_22470 [Streptomyces hundungensis]